MNSKNFHRLSVTSLGLAPGLVFTFLYAASMIIVMSGPREIVIDSFNSILHGIDVTTIMRWEMPWLEMLIGIIEIFILSWLIGATIAAIYNYEKSK